MFKPCPFCGSDSISIHENQGGDHYEPWVMIACSDCYAMMELYGSEFDKEGLMRDHRKYDTDRTKLKEELKRAWNKRI